MTRKKEQEVYVAYHEAGHAVANIFFVNEQKMRAVTITSGRILHYKQRDKKKQTVSRARDGIVIGLAGKLAGEKVVDHTRFELVEIDDTDSVMILRHSFTAVDLSSFSFNPDGSITDEVEQEMIERQRKAFIYYCNIVAEDFVKQHWKEIEAVAKALLEKKTLTRKQVIEIIKTERAGIS